MQLCEEEDDATSPLVAPKSEPNDQIMQAGAKVIVQEVCALFILGDYSSIFTIVNLFCAFFHFFPFRGSTIIDFEASLLLLGALFQFLCRMNASE